MSDLISRQAAINALDAICERECEYSKKQRAYMCGSCRLMEEPPCDWDTEEGSEK